MHHLLNSLLNDGSQNPRAFAVHRAAIMCVCLLAYAFTGHSARAQTSAANASEVAPTAMAIRVPAVSASAPVPQIISLQAPVTVSPELFAPPLKFRDRNKPLTLGEISDLQAQKANADLMRKFGFTDIEPIRPKPVVTTLARPVLTVSALSVFGKPGGLQAEILVNGVFKRVVGQETIGPGVMVAQVHDKGIDLSVQHVVESRQKKRTGHSAVPTTQTEIRRVSVGQKVELTL
jgi:hypothetical protein